MDPDQHPLEIAYLAIDAAPVQPLPPGVDGATEPPAPDGEARPVEPEAAPAGLARGPDRLPNLTGLVQLIAFLEGALGISEREGEEEEERRAPRSPGGARIGRRKISGSL
jgi:hypothetical protein